MRTLVEGWLPPQFLLDLGTYMQTAAHIEFLVWQTTIYAEGVGKPSLEEFKKLVTLKRDTWKLLKRFRESAKSCPTVIADRIRYVADEIQRGIETRNLAAHAAFYWKDQSNGILSADHYFARGQGSARELLEFKPTVTRPAVDETIQVADRLLQEMIALK